MKNIQRVAIITGITKGIGRAIAESLAARGIYLVGVSRNEKNITELCERLSSKHKIDCLAVPTDVSQYADVNTLITRTLERFGRIDILVNNAAVGAFGSIVDSKLDDWQKMIDINLKSVYLCSKAVLPQMMRQKNGTIINISSVCGLRGYAKCGAYCASKFGVNGLTEVLALEAKPSNIQVFAVCPDVVDTTFANNINVSLTNKSNMLKPEDIADRIGLFTDSGARSQVCEIRLKSLNFFQRHFRNENKRRKVKMRTIKYL